MVKAFAAAHLLVVALVSPGGDSAPVTAPAGEKLLVQCGTTKGTFKIELHPKWSPNGVARFVELVEDGFFDGSAFFRCVDNFLVQFGVAADPEKSAKWRAKGTIPDDKRRPGPSCLNVL